MFCSWLEDIAEKHNFEKDYTILGGSFVNPKAAQDMLDVNKNKIQMTEENQEAFLKYLDNLPSITKKKRKIKKHG